MDNSLSGETSILLSGDTDTPLNTIVESKIQTNQPVALNRQNSNKKRVYGQRVTFKDEQLTDTVDCSANNSEQSSNNTSSSDSGIDSNSKQTRTQIQQKSDLNNVNLLKRSDVSIYGERICVTIVHKGRNNSFEAFIFYIMRFMYVDGWWRPAFCGPAWTPVRRMLSMYKF